MTEIAPDAGFAYLNGVSVNVNVPQSGGDSGNTGGDAAGDAFMYFDTSNFGSVEKGMFFMVAFSAKIDYNGAKTIMTPLGVVQNLGEENIGTTTYYAMGIAPNAIFVHDAMGTITVWDFLKDMFTEEALNSMPKFTKEEYLNLG